MDSEALLPTGFEDLEPFVDRWALENTESRWNARAGMEMAEIEAFYDAVLPRAEEALALVQPYDLASLTGPMARLYKLVLSLVHAAMAVELHGAPRARYSPFPHSIKIAVGPGPFA